MRDRLLLIFGDSIAMEFVASLLCFIERHMQQRPDTLHPSFGPAAPTLVASYSNGLHIAHTTLPNTPDELGRTAATVAQLRERAVSHGARSDLPVTMLLMGGGSHGLGHHWWKLPTCAYVRDRKARQYKGIHHKLAHTDDPRARPACVATYDTLANESVHAVAEAVSRL